MSKEEEFMNIQTCVLKVNIHCYGCKQKVKKILQKIEGVATTKIDADQGKVTVSGSVDPSVLIKNLAKSGKHAEILGAPKTNYNPNQSHLANQLNGIHIDNGNGGKKNNNDKGPKNDGRGIGNTPKMDQQQKLKGFQDLKLSPQLKDLESSVPVDKNQNHKGVKFDVPEEEDDDDGFSDADDEFTDDDDLSDDEFDDLHSPSNKMKPNMMMPNNQQMMMKAQKNANLGGGSTKHGGLGVSGGGKGEQNGGGGGRGDSGSAGNQNQGGGKNGGQNVGGGHPQDGRNGGEGGSPNPGRKVNGAGSGPMAGGLPAGFLPMGRGGPPNMSMPIGGLMGMGDPMGNIPAAGLSSMGGAGPSNMTMPIGGPMCLGGLMGNIPAVHGLPTTGASGIPPGYLHGAGPDPVQMQQQHQQQQQYLAVVMNQQRAMESERFQPMMYVRPPLAVNYMPPQIHLHQYPNPYDTYPYPYPLHGNDQYSHVSYEENTSSCDIM